jgi:hypothetical protein
VRVQKDSRSAWGITEHMNDQGATLLLPESFPQGTRVTLSYWGGDRPTESEVVRWESLRRASLGLFRLEVRSIQS